MKNNLNLYKIRHFKEIKLKHAGRVLSTLTGICCVIDIAPITAATAISQANLPTIAGWECTVSLWVRPGLKWNIQISKGGRVLRIAKCSGWNKHNFILTFYFAFYDALRYLCRPVNYKCLVYNDNTLRYIFVKVYRKIYLRFWWK